ncbi:MAG: hypothetical protein ACOCRK_01265 [bacterium]
MSTYIQLNNYFFEPTEYVFDPTEIGETRRNPWTGTINTQITARYNPFDLTFKNISPTQLSHFIYLNNLCKPLDGNEPQDLDYVDIYDNSYTVTIPLNGFKYTPEEGAEETYTVKLRLEEVV